MEHCEFHEMESPIGGCVFDLDPIIYLQLQIEFDDPENADLNGKST